MNIQLHLNAEFTTCIRKTQKKETVLKLEGGGRAGFKETEHILMDGMDEIKN